ncbi:MAG: tRNA (cytidine(34)-2'-O)-methyltransferase [Elusimicrobiales bacterium]
MKVVLINPQIPQNTGNIARTCAANNITLILVGKLGFSLDDKYLKRAGLDYWQHINLEIFKDIDKFFESILDKNLLLFFSTKGQKLFWQAPYHKDSYLIFGSETEGFPKDIYQKYLEQFYLIPMKNSNIRSLNLATSCGIVVYEAIRQLEH